MTETQLKNLFEERNSNASLTAEEINFFNEVTKPEDNTGVKTEKKLSQKKL